MHPFSLRRTGEAILENIELPRGIFHTLKLSEEKLMKVKDEMLSSIHAQKLNEAQESNWHEESKKYGFVRTESVLRHLKAHCARCNLEHQVSVTKSQAKWPWRLYSFLYHSISYDGLDANAERDRVYKSLQEERWIVLQVSQHWNENRRTFCDGCCRNREPDYISLSCYKLLIKLVKEQKCTSNKYFFLAISQ